MNLPEWKKLQKVQKSVAQKVFEHLNQMEDVREIMEQGWSEFYGYPEEEIQLDTNHLLFPVFASWLMYNWQDDLNEYLTIAESFIDRNFKLSPLELGYLNSVIHSQLSFWEVLEVIPGEKLVISDLLGINKNKKKIEVYEYSASQALQAGHIIFAKTASVGNYHYFESVAPIPIPPIIKSQILDFKKWAIKEFNYQSSEDLDFEFQLAYFEFFHDIFNHLLKPRPIKFTNYSGHPLVLNQIFYEVQSPDMAFDALHPLCHVETKEDLLERAKFSKDGDIVSIEFPWLAKKTKKNPHPTVLGNISISSNQLKVEVNSTERSALFQKTIKKLMPKGRYLIKEIKTQNIEEALKNQI